MKSCWRILICILLLLCTNRQTLIMAQSLTPLRIIDTQFIEKQNGRPYYFVGANLGDISPIATLDKSNRVKVLKHTALSLKELGIKNVSISLQELTDSYPNQFDETDLDDFLSHLKKYNIGITIGIPVPDRDSLDNYERSVRSLIEKFINPKSGKDSFENSIIAWKFYKKQTLGKTNNAFFENLNHLVSWIKSEDKVHLTTVSMPIPTDNDSEKELQSIMEMDGVDFVSISADPYELGWVTPSNLFSGLARVYIRMDERLDACNRIAQRVGKPYILDEVCYPRDAMARSIGTLSDARNSFFNYIFHKISDSFQYQTPLSAIFFDYDEIGELTVEEDNGNVSDTTNRYDWKAKAVFSSDSKSLEIVSSAIKSLQ